MIGFHLLSAGISSLFTEMWALISISDPSAPARLSWQQMQRFPISITQSEQNISVLKERFPAGSLFSTRLCSISTLYLAMQNSQLTERAKKKKKKKKIPFSQCGGVPRVDLRGQKEASADKQRQRERAINKRRGSTTEGRVWTQRPTKLNCLTSLLSNGPKSRKQGDTS